MQAAYSSSPLCAPYATHNIYMLSLGKNGWSSYLKTQSCYMRLSLILICLGFFYVTSAQKVIDVNKQNVTVGNDLFFTVGGEPFVNAKFVSLVEGTPYFKDEWLKGSIIMPAGKEYKDISVKVDLFDNELHYLDAKDVELVATSPVKEVVISDALGNSYRFVHTAFITQTAAAPKKGWLLLLSPGTASLYKSFTKVVSESKPYGSATTEQRMRTNESYMVYYNNSLLEIKKIKDAPTVLANKQKELEEFLKNKDDKKLSMDERFKALIEYYNSLVKE
jgi:hypothetical protein